MVQLFFASFLPLTISVVLLRLLVLSLALLLDAALGSPRIWQRVPHPVVWLGKLISFLERHLNRGGAPNWQRFMAGLVTVAIVITVAAVFGWSLLYLPAVYLRQEILLFVLVQIVWVAILLAQRSLFQHVAAVAKALQPSPDSTEYERLEAGRAAVAQIVGRDTASLDSYGVARAAIESLAENSSDGVVAPALWYLLGGLTGITVYKAINSLDSMIGHHSLRYEWFGKVAARLDDLANYIPARVSGFLVVMAAALIPVASAKGALQTIWRDAGRHRSINAGWPEAAVAGAMDYALAGPRSYHGRLVSGAWIGEGRARLTSQDIVQSLRLMVFTALVFLLVILSVGLVLIWYQWS